MEQEILILNLDQQDQHMVRAFELYRADIKAMDRLKHSSDKRPKIRFLQSANAQTCLTAIAATGRIVHLMGHGSPFGWLETRNQSGSQVRNVRPREVAGTGKDGSKPSQLDCLIFDSCYSGGLLWRRQFRNLVRPGRELIVIGSSFTLPFYQSELFFAWFYTYLLKWPVSDRPSVRLRRIYDAFNYAQGRYVNKYHRYSRMRIMTFYG